MPISFFIEAYLDNHLSDNHPFFQSAISDENSPYREIFSFSDYPEEYSCWWGIKSMPEVNFSNRKALDEFVTGENSVVNFWMKQGADAIQDYSLTIINPTDKKMSFDLFVPYSHMYGEVIMRDFFGDYHCKSEDSCLSIVIGPGQCSVFVPDYLYKTNYTYYKKRNLPL